MEEESEKRKERLKAMRMEAVQAGLNNDAGNSIGVPQSFINPLIEATASPSVPIEDLIPPPRFDFYTDPMAAFSANKRMSEVRHQNTPDYFMSPRPRNPHLTPLSVHQFQTQINHFQDTRMFQGQVSSFNPSPEFEGPTGRPNPRGIHGNTNFGGRPSGLSTNQYPSNLPTAVHTPNPGFIQGGSPVFNYNDSPRGGSSYRGSPYSNLQRGNNPQFGYGNQGAPFPGPGRSAGNTSQFGYGNQGAPFPGPGRSAGNTPQFGYVNQGAPFPGPGRSAVNTPQVGYGNRGAPFLEPGRSGGNTPHVGYGNQGAPFPGQGRSEGNSPQVRYQNKNQGMPYTDRGRSGGKGRGSQNHVSAEERPDRYYNISMMEDPWKMLKPVIRQGKCNPTSSPTSDSERSWLPKSIKSKKARVSKALEKYKREQSLAEYLATSFNEVVNESEEENVEESTSEPEL